MLIEVRAYNVVFGLFQAPYYAFSQTMMAELSPPGFDNMVRLLQSPPGRVLTGARAVLWPIRSFQPRIVHGRAVCRPSDHRRDAG